MKAKILVFCDFYLPGFKSGGGMWTVVNLVDRFADRYDFYVVTRNYESKGDRKPYTSVRSSAWNQVGNARVFYLSKEDFSSKRFLEIVNQVRPDAVFLNSAFSMPVVRFLSVRRKQRLDHIPVILAPCGELSAGALSIKPIKKKLFLGYAKATGLYDKVIWKASFDTEAGEIRRVIRKDVEVQTAPDLAPKTILPDYRADAKPVKHAGSVRFIFLSRLTRKKNIHYFIERLAEITTGRITLDLLGPVEDREYHAECSKLIKKCPPNVSINAEFDFIPYQAGLQRMLENHFFVLPTLGENFGYVFVEAMAAGTPLIVSENTVWNELDERGAGWQIPLDSPVNWVEAIKRCVDLGNVEYQTMSANARKYALDWLSDVTVEQATARVIENALSKGRW